MHLEIADRLARRLNELTATEIADAVNNGRATCEDVANACLERIAARESSVQAWQYLEIGRAHV
jgi:Asp-tRNA(Asn)/Glu-tRNA(Gln) amidotransferase A subunit family amidase